MAVTPAWEDAPMGFGQASGPPASARQVAELLALLIEAGHRDFRDARGPMGFTQRQAGGKFTGAEAAAFIEQLLATGPAGAEDDTGSGAPVPRRGPVTAAERRRAEQVRHLRQMPPELLAAELQRQGWIVMAP
ncbi:hypothetical protein BH24ACT3_BH24ACT3_09020 [soil metagenome]